MAQYMKDRRNRRRDQCYQILGNVCSICSSTEQLEIDHIDPSTKSFTLSGAGLDTAWNTILVELAKCQLLCKPHHIEKTVRENLGREPWNKGLRVDTMTPIGDVSHGTMRKYNQFLCRCDECKLAKKQYRNKLIGYDDIILP